MTPYDDIINLPHHVSSKHQPMPMEARAAQFAPFAALNGYDEAIQKIRKSEEQAVNDNEQLTINSCLGNCDFGLQ